MRNLLDKHIINALDTYYVESFMGWRIGGDIEV